MKKLIGTLLLIGCLASSTSVVSATAKSDNGDGFRSSIKQSSFAETVVGGQAILKVPGSSYINAIEGQIYPEFFITMNSVHGSTFDGGVILEGTQWKAVIFGGGVWLEKEIPSITGKSVNLKFAGERDPNDEYIVKLSVTNTDGSEIVVLSVNKDTPIYNADGTSGGTLGWLAENPYYAGLNTVGYELNMVPTHAISTKKYHRTVDINNKRAFFDGAEMSIAVPVTKAGGTLSLDKFAWSHAKNCDDLQYSQSDVDAIVHDVFNQTYLYTTMDFNNLK